MRRCGAQIGLRDAELTWFSGVAMGAERKVLAEDDILCLKRVPARELDCLVRVSMMLAAK